LQSSYIADLVPPPNRAIAYGRVLICPVIVLTLISPVGVMCAAAYKETHLRSIFAIAASLSFVPLVFAVVFLPEPIKGPASGAARDAPADDCRDAPADPRCREAARAGEETNDDAAYPADERPGAPGKSVWTRQLAVLVVVAVLINFPSNATHSLLILYITNRFQACQEECISFILSLFSVSFAVCSIVYIPVAIRCAHAALRHECSPHLSPPRLASPPFCSTPLYADPVACVHVFLSAPQLTLCISCHRSQSPHTCAYAHHPRHLLIYACAHLRIMGTRATLMLGLIFSSVCLSCYALATKLDTIFLTFALEVPALAIQSCLSALFTEAVPKERVGYATGLLTATQTLTQVVSPVFFAVILSSWLRSAPQHRSVRGLCSSRCASLLVGPAAPRRRGPFRACPGCAPSPSTYLRCSSAHVSCRQHQKHRTGLRRTAPMMTMMTMMRLARCLVCRTRRGQMPLAVQGHRGGATKGCDRRCSGISVSRMDDAHLVLCPNLH